MARRGSIGVVDPGWEHCVAQDKRTVKCNYCGKIVWGIDRLKKHLARVSGVAPCVKSPEEVSLRMKENLERGRSRKLMQLKDNNGQSCSGFRQSNNEDEAEEEEQHCWSKRSSRKQALSDGSLLRSSGYIDPGWEHGVADGDMGALTSRAVCQDPEQEEDEEEHDFYSISQDRLMLGNGRFSKDKRKSSGSVNTRSVFEARSKRAATQFLSHSSSKQIKISTSCPNRVVSRKEVTSSISKFCNYLGVPTEAINSLYFQKMIDLVGLYGKGFVVPSSHLFGRFLQDEISIIKDYLREYRSSWVFTGCSIMADTWSNREGKTMISFLVSCPRGVYFSSSIDATDVTEDGLSLFKYLDTLVEDLGEENVVQVITPNTLICRNAGKLLEDKRKNLYWTPCALHSTELVLEDISKLDFVSECLEKAQRITRFIYNQTWLLNLMKNEFTQGVDLLRPAVTRYASSFTTLKSLMDHKASLRGLFQSNDWILSVKSEEGREVEKMVSSAAFWKKVQHVLNSVNPVMQVFHMIRDGIGTLSLPYAYGYMCRAKMTIKSILGDDERKYEPFLRVIDYHWNSLLHHPLYVAAYFFNPAYRYGLDYRPHSEVVSGVNNCIVRLEPDNRRRNTALKQILEYTSAKADFGTDIAIMTRTELDPAAWWQQHGISCLELQRVAVRILSHTCSSVGCESKWSVYDQVNRQCNSQFGIKSTEDLTYVHYNLRLREKQLKRRLHDDVSLPILNHALLDQLLPDWLVISENDKEESLQSEEESENEDLDEEDEEEEQEEAEEEKEKEEEEEQEEEEEEDWYMDSVNGDGEDNLVNVLSDDD